MTKGMSLIQFSTMVVEDRTKTLESGHFGGKDIDIAMITPVGGKLIHEVAVTEDLLKQWKNNPDYRYRHDAYMAWKEGAEPPVNGYDLKMWPPISPAQVKQFNSRNIRSVEELAEIPDDYLTSFGPGSRAIRDKAREWLKSSSDIGKIVGELTVLKEEMRVLKEDNLNKDITIRNLVEKRVEENSILAAAQVGNGKTSRSAKVA